MVDELDAFMRHQIYVEGFKNGAAAEGSSTFDEISASVILLLVKRGWQNLGDVPKRELAGFIAVVNRTVFELFDKRAELTTASLRKFATIDLSIGRKLFAEVTGKATPIMAGALLWAEIMNAPIGNIGVEPKTVLKGLGISMATEMARLIRRGFAEHWSVEEFTKHLVGTKSFKFKDGAMIKFRRQFNTGVSTLVQHISSYTMFKIGSLRHDRYQWVSILDSNTTEICRSRAGVVFSYSDGPRPPAHWGCRSMIIPVVVAVIRTLPTYFAWIRTQPAGVQIDILGQARANALRNGTLNASDLAGFDGMRPISLTQYETSYDNMVLGV